MARNYQDRDLKLLFSRSAGRCSFRGCDQKCIIDGYGTDPDAVIGEIAHIHAYQADGPRGQNGFTEKQLNSYANLMLLCPTHHTQVDKLPNNYSAEDLQQMKEEHEAKVDKLMQGKMMEVGYRDIEMVIQFISTDQPIPSAQNFDIIHIREKISKNSLSHITATKINAGLIKSKEVETFINHHDRLEVGFSKRLRFQVSQRYMALKSDGYDNNQIFDILVDELCRHSRDPILQAASLSIVVHLFEFCDIFEK